MNKKTVFMYPGQGSQFVGMRSKLGELSVELKKIFNDADEILKFSLSGLIDNGPDEKLTLTSNTQPALLVMDLAFSNKIESIGYHPDIVIGHSLGEFAALTRCGTINFEDAIKLVRERGLLMEKAATDTPGKMAAVNRAKIDKLNDVVAECSKYGAIEITNFNSPIQVVLSGENKAIDKAIEIINKNRFGRAIELNVSAPFHSSLMKNISLEFKDYLSNIKFNTPKIDFIDNVTGEFESDLEKIKEKLVLQLYNPVQWVKAIGSAINYGANKFCEIGPGTVLSGLVKKINKEIIVINSENIIASQ